MPLKPLMVIGIPPRDGQPIFIRKRDHKPRPSNLAEVKDFVFAAILQGKFADVEREDGIDFIRIWDRDEVEAAIKEKAHRE